MRSLFFKIFVWFWAAMALVALAVIVTTSLVQSKPVAERWRYVTGTAVGIYAQTAVELYERDGPDKLVIYLQRVEQTAQMRAVLFDERGTEITGRGATLNARQLAKRAGENGEPQIDFPNAPDTAALIARRVYGRGGTRYVLVSEMPGGSRFSAMQSEPGAFVWPVLAMILTGGIVCYGLARYLTAPLAAIRTGVHRIAGGDLSVRLGAKLGTRRDELADLSRDFDLMAERLEALALSQRRLLGDISHELRSPLARLNVALGLARQRAGESARGALDRIEREAERLNELIGQLLTLTRLEIGEEKIERAEIDLRDLVNEIAADADFEASHRRRHVAIVNSDACVISGNEELLRSAIENVIRNAVRYTAEGTTVEVALAYRLTGSQREAVISVSDYGGGVPEATLGELFRPFYRVADARERKTGGTGLGLAITQRAVQLHGGTVEARNAEGGLVVEIRLPAATDK